MLISRASPVELSTKECRVSLHYDQNNYNLSLKETAESNFDHQNPAHQFVEFP